MAQETNETEEETPSPISVNVDIANQFVWRGAAITSIPSIQPLLDVGLGNFNFGAWGSTNFLGNYNEIDLYLSYSIKGFSAILTDYYFDLDRRYFDLNSETTGHAVEIGLQYENEKYPFKIYAGTFFYGDDKKYNYDVNELDSIKQNYSTYIELGYTFNVKKTSLYTFMGLTPFTGVYGNDFNCIYAGVTGSREIILSNKFSLPIYATFAANPQTEKFFVVVGISL